MRKFMLGFVLVLLIGVLAACGAGTQDSGETKGETKEEVFKGASEKVDDVEVYHVDIDLAFGTVTDGESNQSSSQLVGLFNDKNTDLDMKSIDTNGDASREAHIYKVGEEVYVNMDNTQWVHLVGKADEFSNTETSYANLMAAVAELEDVAEMKVTDDFYELRVEGNDVKVIEAFTEPLSLSFTGIDLEEEAKVEFLVNIDKETLFLEDIYLKIDVEDPEGDLNITANIKYKDINNATIEIPQDVIDAASEQ